ncbi:MAG: hypothetical protein U0794_02805 [Isosphaeraceae bacterium]
MKTEQFLEHHGIAGNPFSEEDAQTDTVFKRRCLIKIHHPAWNKFFGSPADPSTALVFGEKGSGKTALRLQAEAELEAYNTKNPSERVFVITYDDFNPYLDHFKTAVRARDAAQALGRWRLQDHMDAILAQGVTQLIDALGSEKVDLSKLSLDQRRDLLLLAALYDQSTGEPIERRWSRLRRRSGFRPLWARRDLQIGFGTTLIVGLLLYLVPQLRVPWLVLPLIAGWLYWVWRLARAEWFARYPQRAPRAEPRPLRPPLGIALVQAERTGRPASPDLGHQRRRGTVRAAPQVPGGSAHARLCGHYRPRRSRRRTAGDRGRPAQDACPDLAAPRSQVLRHAGIGMKLLLPIELAYYLEKEDKDFYDRARPDKLNMIKPLRWTGPSLYDLAGDRLRACAIDGQANANGEGPRLRQLIDESISDDSLKDALGNLRTPRQLFKFLHRLIEEHCHRHTEDRPKWSVDADTFRTTYSAYMRDLEAFDRGYGHG